MIRRLLLSRTLVGAAGLIAGLSLSAALAHAADALVIDKDAVRIQPGLEVGENGAQTNDKGATIQGFTGGNFFQDSEKAGALRVGAAWGVPGIYSQKGDVVVGSETSQIWLNGAVRADSFAGKGAVPVGAILMWSGKPDQLPAGWVLCDGSNNAPDLSGRFVVGYQKSNLAEYDINKTGGEARHTLSVEEIPAHNHGESGQHNHSLWASGHGWAFAVVQTGDTRHTDDSHTVYTSNNGAHTHATVGACGLPPRTGRPTMPSPTSCTPAGKRHGFQADESRRRRTASNHGRNRNALHVEQERCNPVSGSDQDRAGPSERVHEPNPPRGRLAEGSGFGVGLEIHKA